VSVEQPALARRALEATHKGRVGFADHLIAEIAFELGAREIITFDKDFGRKQRVRRLK
jgi:predicted nucleic-acid-binding protein